MAEKDKTRTKEAQHILLSAETYTEGVGRVRHAIRSDTVAGCFDALLAQYGVTAAEAVRRADLDPDFGRQILRGTRGTRRDNYIRLAIGIGLTFQDTQSFLSCLGISPLYALRQRDAAVIFCIQNRYDLMDTQLMLDAHGMLPLSDEEGSGDTTGPRSTREQRGSARSTSPDRMASDARITTEQAETILLNETAYEEAMEKIGEVEETLSIAEFFDTLLREACMNRATLLKRSGINPNIGFHVLRGDRVFKRREPYLRMVFALGLTLQQAQRMLSFLKISRLYSLREQDAAILYCLDRRYDLEKTQEFLAAHRLPPL